MGSARSHARARSRASMPPARAAREAATAGRRTADASPPASASAPRRTRTRLARDSSGISSSGRVLSSRVAIFVGAVVAVVALPMDVHVVEDDAEQPRPDRHEVADGALGGVPAGPALAQDEDDALDLAAEDQRVADAKEGPGVEDDVGEPLAESLDRLAEAAGGEQLGRVDRIPAGGDDGEPRHRRRHDNLVQPGL